MVDNIEDSFQTQLDTELLNNDIDVVEQEVNVEEETNIEFE